MKVNRFLMLLCIAALISIFVFGTRDLIFAKGAVVVEEAQGGTTAVEGQMPSTTPGTEDKGSPMHAWKAIVTAGKKEGDIITSEEFAGMRNWSARTRGYELQSLVVIGVLAPTGTKGEYKLVVGATTDQIDQINERAKPFVGRTGTNGAALGIDSYRLDSAYLGQGNVAAGNYAAEAINVIVKDVTKTTAEVKAAANTNFTGEIADGKVLPAAVAINGDVPFTINGITISGKDMDIYPIEAQAVLAALVDIRIVSPEGKIKGQACDFSATKAKTVMFKDVFVTDNPSGFKEEFGKLANDVTAVIVAIDKNDAEIRKGLEDAGLLQEWGKRIIVMGVKPASPASQAFARLFGDSNIIDLRGQTIDKILKDRDLIAGLKGAV
ncbi:MAG: hypothetical protein NTX47_06695 [Candidatus Omnitrophica bacterium]|nr:hypothetical protein [Candidatus Omnitrophota bacterium]